MIAVTACLRQMLGSLALIAACLPGPAATEALCHKIAVAAEICPTGSLYLAETVRDAGAIRQPALLDMRLRTESHDTVGVTYFAHETDSPLGRLSDFQSGYLDQLKTKGATEVAERYAFRHRGAPAVAQQLTAIHPGPGAGLMRSVAIGVEVSDGLVMILITTEQEASRAARDSWTVSALDALYPD